MSKCPKCGMPVEGGIQNCRLCGSKVSTSGDNSSATRAKFKPNAGSFVPRGRFDDLVMYLFDMLLMIVTFVIGGLIWSIFVASSGQTPAGTIRDKVLIDVKSNSQAATWKIIFRQTFSALSVAYLVSFVFNGFIPIIDIGGYYFATFVVPSLLLGLVFSDMILTLSPVGRRLIDWALAIRWVDGGGYSYRNYAKPGGYA